MDGVERRGAAGGHRLNISVLAPYLNQFKFLYNFHKRLLLH